MKPSRTIALMLLVAGMVGLLATTGCSEDSPHTAPSQQQSVSDVLQEQVQESGPGGQGAPSEAAQSDSFAPDTQPVHAQADYDLTGMGPDLAYATVYDMMANPSTYEGKVIRISGVYYHNRNDFTGNDYFFVAIEDATACCSQGIEFVWGDGSREWPRDYPEDGCEVTVTGVFEVYAEGNARYVHLVRASLERA